jgi:pyocin large subunit-like protein
MKVKQDQHLLRLQNNIDLINFENEARHEAFKHIISKERREAYDEKMFQRRFEREKNAF